MSIRCVVTGQTATGKSVIVRDSVVAPVTLNSLPGFEFHRFWGSDSTPLLPADGTPPPQPTYFPPKGGFRFVFFTIPPGIHQASDLPDVEGVLIEMQAKLPGLVELLEPNHPGMHTADTVDFDIVISGEVYLELDDGVEVCLKPGDCVIQNGTRHAWHNRSDEKAVLAIVLIGGERKSAQ